MEQEVIYTHEELFDFGSPMSVEEFLKSLEPEYEE
jgi:hypothetical protein